MTCTGEGGGCYAKILSLLIFSKDRQALRLSSFIYVEVEPGANEQCARLAQSSTQRYNLLLTIFLLQVESQRKYPHSDLGDVTHRLGPTNTL